MVTRECKSDLQEWRQHSGTIPPASSALRGQELIKRSRVKIVRCGRTRVINVIQNSHLVPLRLTLPKIERQLQSVRRDNRHRDSPLSK